jgi:hypothetical protein
LGAFADFAFAAAAAGGVVHGGRDHPAAFRGQLRGLFSHKGEVFRRNAPLVQPTLKCLTSKGADVADSTSVDINLSISEKICMETIYQLTGRVPVEIAFRVDVKVSVLVAERDSKIGVH